MGGETLDFVDICAPPGSHASLIRRALDAGLHVLCEKPLATRAEDAEVVSRRRRARRTRSTHGSQLAEGPDLPQDFGVDRRRRDRRRPIRPVADVANSARDRREPRWVTNWRVDPALAGGGILFDHGWHALYCVARWAGVPRGVSARLETRRFHE